MCGIAGYVESRLHSVPDTVLPAILADLAHRGPDGSGIWKKETSAWQVALGHRRLSIIDIDGGAQPLGNAEGTMEITFNGEIYSFRELKQELEKLGHRFSTRSDTEVLLHHFEQHGVDGLAQVNGMFAFAVWDSRTDELFLARDRAGIKPLYYAKLPGGGLVFASELSALLRHPQVSREISVSSLAAYFFSDYIPPPATALVGIHKLAPGHSLRWKNGELSEPRPFWRIADLPTISGEPNEISLKAELQERLKTAVKRQLVSDVPVGVFLSGGIDSSLVAAFAQAASPEPIQTFTIAFEEKDFDESGYARLVAAHLGTRHTEELLNEQALLENLDNALGCLDEPMADPSILPTYLLSRLAARHVKVALGGDAGDELWAGYPTYLAHQYARAFGRVPSSLRRHVMAPMVARLPVKLGYQSFEWKAKRFVLRWDDDRIKRHLRWMSNTDLPQLREAFPGLSATPALLALRESPHDTDELNSLLALDFSTYLPGSVLAKVDRASMAHGLEVRPPFLDNDLVQWAFSLPSTCKLKNGRGKHLLKEAAAPYLPGNILNRRKKGFGIPLGRWLRGPLRARLEGILTTSALWDSPLISRPTFQFWHDQHQNLREDFSRPLWALLVLDFWMRRQGLTQLAPS